MDCLLKFCILKSYKECQRAHWLEHKKLCKNITGGTWISTPFLKVASPTDGGSLFMINKFSPTDDLCNVLPTEDEHAIPINAYGTQPFIIKIQVALVTASSIMIYDRRRTLHVYIMPNMDQAAFKLMCDEVSKSPMMGKIYRWAKRSGDLTLSICLDKVPVEQNFEW